MRPSGGGTETFESVSHFTTLKPFRLALPAAVAELDAAARKVAAGVAGKVASSADVRTHGLRGRRYEIVFEHGGTTLRQRITFLFLRRQEFQLLCRYPDADTPPAGCTVLEQTFRAAL